MTQGIPQAAMPAQYAATTQEAYIPKLAPRDAYAALMNGPLDPDTVFAICAQQIKDVDGEIKNILARQKSRTAQTGALAPLAASASSYKEITDGNKDAAIKDLNAQFDAAIKSFPAGSDQRKSLEEQQRKFNENVNHRGNDSDPWMDAGEMKGICDAISSVSTDVSTARELDMMDLQKQMSSRSQILQLFSNIMQKFDQQAMAIINNTK
jgi:hypothetical protein